ncbi:MAG: DUF4194 domain-containing protein [Spirochaetaceae bacterium]|nr:MAG: DUF4194 domain-containing protein [Spirochaetaceae bacterium]
MSYTNDENALSVALVSLLKGVVTRDENESRWQTVLATESRLRDHAAILGLELVVDIDEGYAFFRQREDEDEDIPRLVARRPLSYPVTLVLSLLRRKLAEHDASSGDLRLILDVDEMVDAVRTFLPEGSTEARVTDNITGYLKKVAELGFIRFLTTDSNKFEVRRIIKAFVNAQWLHDLEQRMREYAAGMAGPEIGAENDDA